MSKKYASVDSLRRRVEDETRFPRAISGYDMRVVNEYVAEMKRSLTEAANAAVEERESLLSELDSVRNELTVKQDALTAYNSERSAREAAAAEAVEKSQKLVERMRAMEETLAERDARIAELEAIEAKAIAASADDAVAELYRINGDLSAKLAIAEETAGTDRTELERLQQENEALRTRLDDTTALMQTQRHELIESASRAAAIQTGFSEQLFEMFDKSGALLTAWQKQAAAETERITQRLNAPEAAKALEEA